NLRDFPVASLKQWAGAVIHPQDFLLQLYESDAGRVQKSIEEMSERRRKTPNDILLQLCKSVPRFADRVLEEYRQL
ncbi:MAG: hypothetical protein LBT53_07950, partial [Puniceicoccales bacterium]|nr:hypothetical protein [Puniceicoccales bacterium]